MYLFKTKSLETFYYTCSAGLLCRNFRNYNCQCVHITTLATNNMTTCMVQLFPILKCIRTGMFSVQVLLQWVPFFVWPPALTTVNSKIGIVFVDISDVLQQRSIVIAAEVAEATRKNRNDRTFVHLSGRCIYYLLLVTINAVLLSQSTAHAHLDFANHTARFLCYI